MTPMEFARLATLRDRLKAWMASGDWDELRVIWETKQELDEILASVRVDGQITLVVDAGSQGSEQGD